SRATYTFTHDSRRNRSPVIRTRRSDAVVPVGRVRRLRRLDRVSPCSRRRCRRPALAAVCGDRSGGNGRHRHLEYAFRRDAGAGRVRGGGAERTSWRPYVGVAAVAMGGIGIWSMHFVGMQAQAMPFSAGYDVALTALSFLLAVLCSGAGLWYVARARFAVWRCVAGGVLAGLGVAAMHYVGIAAMRIPAVFQWSLPLVVLSVLVAVVAAVAALWLAFNVHTARQRAMAAAVMAFAV